MTLVADLKIEAFQTTSRTSGEQLQVKLAGCLDMEAAPHFGRFLGTVTSTLRERSREVTFDTADLYMMSSSAISELAQWVKVVKRERLAPRIVFRTNANLAWQRRTLDSIQLLAELLVTVK